LRRDGVAEGLCGNQSGAAADKTGVSDHRKSVMGDPIDRVERGEIELALQTDRVDVIGKARQPAQGQQKTDGPIGWPRCQHNQGLKHYSTEANQRRRQESTNAGNRLGSRQTVPHRDDDEQQSDKLRPGRCGTEEKVGPVVEHYGGSWSTAHAAIN